MSQAGLFWAVVGQVLEPAWGVAAKPTIRSRRCSNAVKRFLKNAKSCAKAAAQDFWIGRNSLNSGGSSSSE